MKKRNIFYSLIFICLIGLLTGCSRTATAPKSSNAKTTLPQPLLAIYLVKDLKPYEAEQVDLKKLTLDTKPILRDSEIVGYNWKDHEFKLSKDVLSERLHGKVQNTGKAFVLVVNGEPIYLGAFWTPLSSVSPPNMPTINSIWMTEEKSKAYKIDYFGNGKDPRQDERIYKILKKLGKLK